MNLTPGIRSVSLAQRPWALKDLPPYRPVAKKLMLLTAQKDVPLAEVQQVLRTDAAFTAEALRFANSPLLERAGKSAAFCRAVMMLGLE